MAGSWPIKLRLQLIRDYKIAKNTGSLDNGFKPPRSNRLITLDCFRSSETLTAMAEARSESRAKAESEFDEDGLLYRVL